ncbi:hypothetical protein BU15DRAFT_74918 [Melanogaster broomeanus]|nr:hypothetical protein BU15DRAFT_74918 [Melanogaster broomeanus]
MAPYFPDETGFQNILEYIGLRFEFIRRATVADTIDPGRCQRNMPVEVALATRVITTAMMQGWNNLEIPHTIRMLLVPTPKADTQQLTEIEQLEEARRHAVITRGLLQAESNKVEGELRLAMERIVQLEEHWSPGDIFDAIKSSEDNGRYSWPFM